MAQKIRRLVTTATLCIVMAFISCWTGGRITYFVEFDQLALDTTAVPSRTVGDVEIHLQPIRIYDIYDYPALFAFEPADFPQYAAYPLDLVPRGPLGVRWRYPFSSPDGSEQALLFMATVKNRADTTLKLKDLEFSLTSAGRRVRAIAGIEQLLAYADHFDSLAAAQWEKRSLQIGEYPRGFKRSMIESKRDAYVLVCDSTREIQADSVFVGLLVFALEPATPLTAKLDIVRSRASASTNRGGPPETCAQFSLRKEHVFVLYDRAEKAWKRSHPPANTR